jgi:hypothetical protein
MTRNVGNVDGIIRFIIGLALIIAPIYGVLGLTLKGPLGVAGVIIGFVLLTTASFRFCPIYRVIGASTCKN